LCVASSGIAALLLPGVALPILLQDPIPCHESSICSIPKTSQLAELIRMTDLVIWDEALMQHHHNMEAVDRTFRDILNNSEKPFGGLSVVFGGTLDKSCLLSSGFQGRLWVLAFSALSFGLYQGLHLHQNMRLNTTIEAERNFARWQLEVGQGMHTDEEAHHPARHFKCEENKLLLSSTPSIWHQHS